MNNGMIVWVGHSCPTLLTLMSCRPRKPKIKGVGQECPTHNLTRRQSPSMLQRRQICSRQQKQSRKESPEHQAHGQGKWTVDFLEVQPGKREDIGVLESL